ncbi:MAG TPA: alpha/beta hydrolase [Bacteroidia bacterium]|nr:alpha/beta hydrolase [Bacteroidia bacterium]
MRKLNQTILTIVILLGLLSCKKNLNDNLFNPSKITEYKLDDYGGTVDFRLNEDYYIPDSSIHVFQLKSKAKDEADSTKIWAIYIGDFKKVGNKELIANDSVIVYFHGNKDHMDFYWQRAKLLAHTGGKLNFGVLMIDYRGYGMSDGKSTEESMYADANAAINWIKEKGVLAQRYAIYGFSLGCAAATYATYYTPPSYKPFCIALEAPFASVATLINDGAALNLDPLFFTTFKCDNNDRIKKIQQPFYWIHGTKDKFIPIETNGEVLFKNYTGTISEAQRIEGADHSDVPQTMGFAKYNQTLYSFFGRKK